jgi:hypothetical protein
MGTFAASLFRYIPVQSASPNASLKSIIIGQLYRFAAVSQNPTEFLTSAAHLFLQLLNKGHNPTKIQQIARQFLLPRLPYIQWTLNNLHTPLHTTANRASIVSSLTPLPLKQGVRHPQTTALLNLINSNTHINQMTVAAACNI